MTTAAVVLLLTASFPAHASGITLSGWAGARHTSYRTTSVRTTATFRITPRDAAYVAITEVYPDDQKPVCYHYLVTGSGVATFERRYAAKGFGPVTYFLRVHLQPALRIAIENRGDAKRTPQILAVRGVTTAEIAAARHSDRFTLMGTVINPHTGASEDEQAARIDQHMPTQAGRRISKGFSYEVLYASANPEQVRGQITKARAWAEQHRMPVLLGLVSWWNGTPRTIPDGLGGAFGDLKYQQICYTPGHEHAEDEGLRALLGPRYNRHYRRTVPNIWSNTPWLTMNSPALNTYRARRLQEAISLVREVGGGDLRWLAGIYLENEPRYWDTQSTQGTPQWAGEQWADFNPMTVAAAARDAVTLDPNDGMSPPELAWLQRNVARYNEQTAAIVRTALRQCGAPALPVYTHSLQLDYLFPGVKMNRTATDWACVPSARTGIEGMWTQPSDFDRVREWGPWCNLNREETDGQPIDTHLWDLRTAYAMGAELFNSYNWHTLKDNAYFGYARRFLDALPTIELPPAKAEIDERDSLTITPPQGLQAFSRVTVTIARPPDSRRCAALSVDGSPERTWYSERVKLPPAGGTMAFAFPAPAEIAWSAKGTIHLHAYDAAGVEIPNGAAFASDAVSSLRLAYNLDEARALSRVVIGWRTTR